MPRKPPKNSLDLKNFIAWIEVDGKRVDCHAIDIPNKRAREASCWVASEENKTFSVKLAKTPFTKCHYRVSLSLDGTRTDNEIVRISDNYTVTFDGLVKDGGFRHYKFAPLNVTDEEEYRDTVALRPETRHIGEITLRVHRITSLKKTKHKIGEAAHCGGESEQDDEEEDSDKESVPQPQKVHESSLKATLIPHQISFGDFIPNAEPTLSSAGVEKNPLQSSKSSRAKTEYYTMTWYTKRECLATFTFRYRPLDVLVDGGIVPRRLINPQVSEDENEDEEEDVGVDMGDGTVPDFEPALNTSNTVASTINSRQSISETMPTETGSSIQTVQGATAVQPVDDRGQTSSVIRQESQEPPVNMGGATVGVNGQSKGLSLSRAVAKDETYDIKLEEIEQKISPSSDVDDDDEEDEEERELRLKLEAIKERKRKNKELRRADAAKRVKTEPDNRFYFKPGEVVDLVSS